jgi:hypothetical protein
VSTSASRGPFNSDANLGNSYRSFFEIGGISVQIIADRIEDVDLLPALEPFRIQSAPPNITIQVNRAESISASPEAQLFDSGSVWRLYQSGDKFQFDFTTPVLGDDPYKRMIVDDHFTAATLLLSDRRFKTHDAGSSIEYPLDELLIMHRLTREKAVELHGCGISMSRNNPGVLFIGHSGAGKSTTARLWTSHHDAEILSDDRIILRDHAGEISMYGTPWHGEAAYASPAKSPLTRIFILEHGQGNVITRLTRIQAVSELFARSFVPFHRHEYVDHALSFLESVVDTIPCYRYSFEPDQRAVETILQFHD